MKLINFAITLELWVAQHHQQPVVVTCMRPNHNELPKLTTTKNLLSYEIFSSSNIFSTSQGIFTFEFSSWNKSEEINQLKSFTWFWNNFFIFNSLNIGAALSFSSSKKKVSTWKRKDETEKPKLIAKRKQHSRLVIWRALRDIQNHLRMKYFQSIIDHGISYFCKLFTWRLTILSFTLRCIFFN